MQKETKLMFREHPLSLQSIMLCVFMKTKEHFKAIFIIITAHTKACKERMEIAAMKLRPLLRAFLSAILNNSNCSFSLWANKLFRSTTITITNECSRHL